ncbi:hypothetical protein NDU88_004207 [Pleurodeles waltl]|uniref:Uncharacterized protein n=1 Tax=Pleurodeles waltl TaxID=8319 RepID=A0AAV7NIQ5_PLEWA|nr:hypothetical protein NDU88_004207 [Pleurodeles waltl]
MAAVCQLNAWVTCFRFHVVQTKNDSTKMAAGTRQTDVFAQPHHADEIAVCLQRTHNTVLLPNSQTILCPCGAAQPKTHRNIGECGGKDTPGCWCNLDALAQINQEDSAVVLYTSTTVKPLLPFSNASLSSEPERAALPARGIRER